MNKQFLANTALCVVLGGLVACAFVNISSAVTPKGFLAKDPEPSALMNELQDKVVLDKYEAGEESGRIVKNTFYVNNHSQKDVKNVNVRCEFYGEKSNYLDQELWILPEVSKAGQTTEYNTSGKRFIHREAKAVHCRIVDLQLAKASFFTLHRSSAKGNHGAAVEDGHGNTGHEKPAH